MFGCLFPSYGHRICRLKPTVVLFTILFAVNHKPSQSVVVPLSLCLSPPHGSFSILPVPHCAVAIPVRCLCRRDGTIKQKFPHGTVHCDRIWIFPRSSGENITKGQGTVVHSKLGAAQQNSMERG